MKNKWVFIAVMGITAILILYSCAPIQKTDTKIIKEKVNEDIQLLFLSDKNKSTELTSIAIDGDGNKYVVDSLNARVEVFDRNNNFKFYIGKKGDNDGEFYSPCGIAIDKNNFIYITDIKQNRIQIFDKEGRFVKHFDNLRGKYQKFNKPVDIAVTDNDYVYVLNAGNCSVQIFRKDSFLFKFGREGKNNGEFIDPKKIVVSKDNKLHIVDTGNSRIQIFNQYGQYLYSIGSNGLKNGEFLKPQDIAFDKYENIYVSDSEKNNIQVFNSNGKYEFSFGTKGTSVGELNNPVGLNYYDNKLYVIDKMNARIQIYSNLLNDYAPCAYCHGQTDSIVKNAESVHPYFEDDCEKCHRRHYKNGQSSKFENTLCLNCHKDMSPEIHKNDKLNAVECIECHSPHAANSPKLLIGHMYKNKKISRCEEACHAKNRDIDRKKMCSLCHNVFFDSSHNMSVAEDSVKKKFTNVNTEEKNSCLVCHKKHGSINNFQLINDGNKACYICHDSSKLKHEHMVDAVAGRDMINPQIPLGPGNRLVCYSCHSVHKKNEFILRFKKHDLCEKCHGKKKD